MKTNPDLLLGDDHNIVRQGTQMLLEELVPNANIYHANRLEQVLSSIEAHAIDFAILDAVFPDGNCISILQEIRVKQPDIKILIFSSLDEEKFALKFIQAGANGFLSKLSEEATI